jgi:hypothetical protein
VCVHSLHRRTLLFEDSLNLTSCVSVKFLSSFFLGM